MAGITVVAAAIAVGAQLARGGSPPSPGARPAAVAPPLAPAPDISSMTPREQADRLFDRIMRARERGDEQEAGFFRPMAVQAYTALGALDVDARYHLGLIHAVTGDLVSARSQRDALLDTNPGHLLTILLEAEIARLEADTAALRGAYAQFLDRVDRELQTGKPEYRDHQPALDAFRDEARRTPGG